MNSNITDVIDIINKKKNIENISHIEYNLLIIESLLLTMTHVWRKTLINFDHEYIIYSHFST